MIFIPYLLCNRNAILAKTYEGSYKVGYNPKHFPALSAGKWPLTYKLLPTPLAIG